MAESDIEPGHEPSPETSEPASEAQRAADGLKGQIAALRDQVRQARNDLLNADKRKSERRSFKD